MSEAVVEPTSTDVPVTTPTATPTPGWRESLSEGLRSHPSMEKFETTEALGSGYINLEKLVGKKGVIPPGEGDGPEVYDRFYNEMGRPETVDGYDLSEVDIPEALQPFWDDDLQSSMVAGMHELGMSQSTVKGLLNLFAGKQAEMLGAMNMGVAQANAAAQADLKTEYGTAYEAKIDVGKRAFREAFGEGSQEIAGIELVGGGMLGNHPAIMRAFVRLGESMNEAELLGEKTNTSFAMSPADAQNELNRLTSDKDFQTALYDSEHQEHTAAVERQASLFAQVHPEEG